MDLRFLNNSLVFFMLYITVMNNLEKVVFYLIAVFCNVHQRNYLHCCLLE